VIVNHPPPPETLHQYTGPTSCITDKLVHEIVLESAGFDFRVQIYFTTSSKTLVTLCVVLIFDSFFFLVVNVPTSHCEQALFARLISHQPAIFFSHNKPAPTVSHQPMVSGVARQTSTVLPPFFTLVVVYSTFAGKV
jgi:hypothetical protein